jgi:hypothetical protein
MSTRTLKILAAAYALVGLLTFGVAWNVDHEGPRGYISAEERNMMRSLMCSFAWPLYLSVKAFSTLRATS